MNPDVMAMSFKPCCPLADLGFDVSVCEPRGVHEGDCLYQLKEVKGSHGLPQAAPVVVEDIQEV